MSNKDDGSKTYLDFLKQQIDELESIKQYHRNMVNVAMDYLKHNPDLPAEEITLFKAQIALHREILDKLWGITLPVGYVSGT